jgi:hypothetical protein
LLYLIKEKLTTQTHSYAHTHTHTHICSNKYIYKYVPNYTRFLLNTTHTHMMTHSLTHTQWHTHKQTHTHTHLFRLGICLALKGLKQAYSIPIPFFLLKDERIKRYVNVTPSFHCCCRLYCLLLGDEDQFKQIFLNLTKVQDKKNEASFSRLFSPNIFLPNLKLLLINIWFFSFVSLFLKYF